MNTYELIWENVKGKALQHKYELIALLDFMVTHEIRNVLEIGTYKGGTAEAFLSLGCRVTCIDAVKQPEVNDLKVTFIESDSKNAKDKVKQSFDMLYIDGGHGYEDAEQDYENYIEVVRKGGVIVFHDIRPFDGQNTYGCAVFWKDLSSKHKHFFEIKDYSLSEPNWGGFGVILL